MNPHVICKIYFFVLTFFFLLGPTSSFLRKRLKRPRCPRLFTRAYTAAQIETYLDKLSRTRPDLVQLQSIGTTHMKRHIRLVKVTSNKNSDRFKPAIWIDGGIHAREWITPLTILNFINTLVMDRPGCDSTNTKWLLDHAIFYFVPILNPDGYFHSFLTNHTRLWRKNRRPKSCPNCCVGVDLNRNYDFDFDGSMAKNSSKSDFDIDGTFSSEKTCSDVYRGPYPFSEPETRAVRDFVLSRRNGIKAFLTVHSYGQMFLVPSRNDSTDFENLRNLANRSVKAIKALRGTEYSVGTAAELLFPIAGASFDWAKYGAEIKYSYGIELSPIYDGRPGGFMLPKRTETARIYEEIWAGLNVVFDQVIREFFNREK